MEQRDGSSALLSLAAELGGVGAAQVDAVGAMLLRRPRRVAPLTRSTLNNDGTPLQVCVTAHARGRTVRLVGDPGAHSSSSAERVATARAALADLCASSKDDALERACARLLASVLPCSLEQRPDAVRGVLWLGAPLAGEGLALYVRARWDTPEEDWERCRRAAQSTLPCPSAAHAQIDALRRRASPLSVGLETAAGRARLKLYWRLRQPVPLATLGVEPLADAGVHDFLRRTVGSRRIPSTGLVFSTSFSLSTGELSDAKVDVCGHCVPRSSRRWAAVIESLVGAHGLSDPRLREALHTPRAEVAFVGFGLDRAAASRVNVYLKAASASHHAHA